VVVTAPLFADVPLPLLPAPRSSAPDVATPEYSAIRRSGNGAAAVNVTVTVFAFAAALAMFCA
jgi:hypothetical protein